MALKVPHFSADRGIDVAERFRREGQALASLKHRFICQVYGAGQADGVLYLAMEHIEGKPLSDILVDGEPMDARSAAKLAGKLALALANAHETGVVHRDLKPANVMIDHDGQPVIMDFGLAKLMAAEDQLDLSHTGMILGTPSYMPPEQAGGETQVGPSADIYSLGVMFYEMLTGRLPFEMEGLPLGILLGVILTQPPDPPTKYLPDLDPKLEAICLKAIQKSASDRYGSMREFADALSAFLKESKPPSSKAEESIWNEARTFTAQYFFTFFQNPCRESPWFGIYRYRNDRTPRICWKTATTSAPYRNCRHMPASKEP